MWQCTIPPIKLFGFYTFYEFFGFLTQSRVKNGQNQQTTKVFKQQKQLRTWNQQSSVCFTQLRTIQDRYVKHTTHMSFKEWYPHRWSYGAIRTEDHWEVWWRCLHFGCLCEWIQDIRFYLPPNHGWSDSESLCVWTLSAKQDSWKDLWH